MWDCSSEELISRIEGLQDNQVIPMSQCGFIFFVSGMKIAIDVMVSDLIGGDGKSRRIVPPPFGCDELPSLDILLVTHDHADHLDRAVVESQMRRNPECRIIAPASILDSLDIPHESKIYLSDMERYSTGDCVITPVPVPHMEYHETSPHHSDFYGYILEYSGMRIFHGGDMVSEPDLIERLREYSSFDYAFLPINGRDSERESRGIIGNMHPDEAVEFALEIHARTLVPTHFDMIAGNTGDLQAFRNAAEGRIGYIVPVPGKAIELNPF